MMGHLRLPALIALRKPVRIIFDRISFRQRTTVGSKLSEQSNLLTRFHQLEEERAF
jgi:hypothetical protein